MGLLSRLRKRLGSSPADDAPRSSARPLPEPIRGNLRDSEHATEHFTHVSEWDTWQPGDPAWQIPDIGQQVAWITDLVDAHAASGDLDGLVPDLLDREIHHRMDEVREGIDAASVHSRWTEQILFEQAKLNQHELSHKLKERVAALETLQGQYRQAYEFLTGRAPALPTHPLVTRPTLIPTEVADHRPVPEPGFIPSPPLELWRRENQHDAPVNLNNHASQPEGSKR